MTTAPQEGGPESAVVSLMMADYVGVDSLGKANIIGGGITVAGVQASGFTSPLYVVVLIDLDRRLVGQSMPVTVELRDNETGTAVEIPGPDGLPAPLRVSQLMQVNYPMMGQEIVPEPAPARLQAVLGFNNGIPLAIGRMYEWRVTIGAATNPSWRSWFYVPGPPPPPVFGGPNGPSSIEGIQP